MVGSIRRFLETTFCVSRDARMGAAVEVVLNDLVDAGLSPDAGLEAFVAVYSSSVVSTPLAPALGVLGSALIAAGLEAARHALGRGEDAIAAVADTMGTDVTVAEWLAVGGGAFSSYSGFLAMLSLNSSVNLPDARSGRG